MWVGGQRHAPTALNPGKRTGIIVQEAEWAPGPGWTVAKNLTPTGIQSRTLQPVASRYTDWDIVGLRNVKLAVYRDPVRTAQ
jgi:hypothetical protein